MKQKQKNWQAVSKSLTMERKKYRACLRDIVSLEKNLCVCADAYRHMGEVDPSCMAHDYAGGILNILKFYGISMKHTEVQDVYFIQSGNAVKIGIAKDPDTRLRELQTGNCEHLVLLAVVPGGGGALEKELHRKFRKTRIQGEWYELNHELSEWINNNARPA